jgi:hypothetical protein
MRFKADTGESNTGLFKEVKMDRGRPMASRRQSGYLIARRAVAIPGARSTASVLIMK